MSIILTQQGKSMVVDKIGSKPLVEGVSIGQARSFARKITTDSTTDSTTAPPTEKEAKRGDLVQWSPGDIDQFKEPKKVIRVKDGFAFVRDSDTGMPLSELTVQQKGGQ